MNYILELTSSELELIQSVLKFDLDCILEMLCDNMKFGNKMSKDFESFLVYRACHSDKILDKIEEIIA